MVQKNCALLPLADMSRFRSRMSSSEKLRRCSALIAAAPEVARASLAGTIERTSNLNSLLNECRMMQREVCSHAALGVLLEPSLRTQLAIALYKSEERHHELILSTVTCNRDFSSEVISQFLVEVEIEGIESAVMQILERETIPFLGRSKEPATNSCAGRFSLSEFLLEVAAKSKDARRRILAVKWLPFFTATVAECIELLERVRHNSDSDVRAMAAIQLSYVKTDYPRIEQLLWNPMEHQKWCGNEFIFANGTRGRLQKLALKRLIDIACETGSAEQRQLLSDGSALFWQKQMTGTTCGDREAFHATIAALYRAIRLTAPITVLWFESPRRAAVAAAIFETCTTQSSASLDWTRSYSKVDSYIAKLIRLIESFPNFSDHSRKNWSFGLKHWKPAPEYEDERFIPWCGTHMPRYPQGWAPQRPRHIWDVISAYDHPAANEIENALDILRDNDVLDLNAAAITAAHKIKQRTNYFMSRLLDHARLGMTGYRSVLKQIGACPHSFDGLEHLMQMCPSFLAFDDIVIACERPTKIHRDRQGRLHNLAGPSIEFADGWGVYCANGISVRPSIITQPESIRAAEIIMEWNLELRRIMLEQCGIERFIKDSGAQLLSEDKYGSLYSLPMERDAFNMVRVRNSTPEPDGSHRIYFIAVPPDTKTAHEAVAWTFGLSESEYAPAVET